MLGVPTSLAILNSYSNRKYAISMYVRRRDAYIYIYMCMYLRIYIKIYGYMDTPFYCSHAMEVCNNR